jgi:dihydroneopterin aldolase
VSQTLRLEGIRAQGRHGASAGERDAPQPFTVDLEVDVETAGDELARTADYREIVAAVRAVIEEESHTLIETLARRVAHAVADLPRVRTCRAVVHKPAAAERLGIEDVTAEGAASGGAAL